MKKFDKYRLMGAISGAAIAAGALLAQAEPIDKEIICKLPEYREYPLKLHSCATLQYPLAPLDPEVDVDPSPGPAPGPYIS